MKLIQAIFNNRKNTSNEVLKTYLNKLNLISNFKVINVVGTNGKGSVSHYLTENLKGNLNVGTFTSPHIFEANERIKFNGENISIKKLEKLIYKYLKTDIHFFGIMFLCAIEYFNKMGCDVIILEAGIGGKYDPSNILNGDVGVITSLGYDHMEIFGDTLEDVLMDKIGIINKGMKFYSGDELKELNKIISKEAKNKKAEHIIIKNSNKDYKVRNQLLVKDILLNEFNIEPIFNEPIGRSTIQEVNGTKAILDVAHNKDGILATLKHLENHNINFEQVVITISKRKQYHDLPKIFSDKKVFVFKLNEMFISASDIGAINVDDLKKFYIKQKQNTLYIGSFYSIGEILKYEK